MKQRFFVLLLLAALGGAALFAVPRPDLLKPYSFSKAIYDQNHRLLRLTLSTDDKFRLQTSLNEISPYLKEATLLKEDRYFYGHPGFNPFSLFRAAWQTYLARSRRTGAPPPLPCRWPGFVLISPLTLFLGNLNRF